jgi:hypothetical protein
MKEHFNLRSLMFYGCAISAVVTLFSVVTAYGEANLKAPRRIDGRYPITTQTLPGCLQSQALVLLVQQSGIYLTGAIVPTDASGELLQSVEKRPPLGGRWDDRQLYLSGALNSVSGCQGQITVQSTVSSAHPPQKDAPITLEGTLRLSDRPQETPFTATGSVSASQTHTAH